MNKIKIGDKAIDFKLQDQNGIEHTLDMYTSKGKKVLIYFYPKDDTPGCTTEACNFRDKHSDLSQYGLVVLGISKDSVKSHKKFADKYDLNFPLLSDETVKTVESYGAWQQKKFMGREYMGIVRMSVLIGTDGKILKIYDEVKPKDHTQEVMKDV